MRAIEFIHSLRGRSSFPRAVVKAEPAFFGVAAEPPAPAEPEPPAPPVVVEGEPPTSAGRKPPKTKR